MNKGTGVVVVEIITAGGILALISFIFRHIFMRVKDMETKHAKALYKEDGQLIYMSEGRCRIAQEGLSEKIDEIKTLIIKMDEKREKAKDQMAGNQLKIETRLTKIETKIGENGRSGP
jgi:hypothetical protein